MPFFDFSDVFAGMCLQTSLFGLDRHPNGISFVSYTSCTMGGWCDQLHSTAWFSSHVLLITERCAIFHFGRERDWFSKAAVDSFYSDRLNLFVSTTHIPALVVGSQLPRRLHPNEDAFLRLKPSFPWRNQLTMYDLLTSEAKFPSVSLGLHL